MRNIIILILVSAAGMVLLITAGCKGCGRNGSGHVITQDRPVKPFNRISIEGVLPVEISQDGGKEYVKVQTDDNLQELINVECDGGELVIKTEKKLGGYRNSTKMKIYVNISKIDEISFNSVGNLTTNGTLRLDSLELNSSSVGKIDLDVNANFLRANLQSVGSTTLKGKVREARINNKSVGSLNAFDLKAGTVMIHNTAVGGAEVYADSAFYIRSSAIGSLYYKGPGVVKELTSDGVGRVQKKE